MITGLLIVINNRIANLMETFTVQKCSIHKDTPSDFLALEHEVRRVCALCPIDGNSYVVSNLAF
jgi:hypothetical protein